MLSVSVSIKMAPWYLKNFESKKNVSFFSTTTMIYLIKQNLTYFHFRSTKDFTCDVYPQQVFLLTSFIRCSIICVKKRIVGDGCDKRPSAFHSSWHLSTNDTGRKMIKNWTKIENFPNAMLTVLTFWRDYCHVQPLLLYYIRPDRLNTSHLQRSVHSGRV